MQQDIESLLTIRDFVRWGASRFNEEGLFFGHGTDNALDEAAVLVLSALSLPSDLTGAYFDCRVTASERERILAILSQRIDERVPAAYLTNEAVFAGLKFYVDERVLVPRSPIAELIENGFSPWVSSDSVGRVLDLCTGSGCIAIGCAHYFADASVDAVDISPRALDVARINIERHQLTDRVEPILSDLFDGLKGRQYDLIVSNPPYVSLEEYSHLPVEYHREPILGLEAGRDGLDLISRILAQGVDYLEPGGVMVVEVGSSAEALVSRYPDIPFMWLDFQRGGDGVFLLTAEELNEYRPFFS
ncbi:MAG: 50S ribosomal protein L3 N(5)-glutamine methyltransferase [Gammaproteobacteria bacterium]|nr:50S ribosomal protein L3 N(5)-glutamine methyltransferase [Gammaproteobacteria bacterium]HXK56987.1 50S ribosomal protein L3 N(5)-glutamine methyltransferase [Gammaproteobacteria bacterium]